MIKWINSVFLSVLTDTLPFLRTAQSGCYRFLSVVSVVYFTVSAADADLDSVIGRALVVIFLRIGSWLEQFRTWGLSLCC